MKFFIIFALLALFTSTDQFSKREFKIILQPVGNYSPEEVDFVADKISKSYAWVEVRKALPLPSYTLNDAKARHRANKIIAWLFTMADRDESIIGITSDDISITKGVKNDFGIMGLGFCPGKACIASSYRLNKSRKKDQLYKIVIHEYGHNLGLPHCEENGCYMMDAKGKNHTDGLHHFCNKCVKIFQKKKWITKLL